MTRRRARSRGRGGMPTRRTASYASRPSSISGAGTPSKKDARLCGGCSARSASATRERRPPLPLPSCGSAPRSPCAAFAMRAAPNLRSRKKSFACIDPPGRPRKGSSGRTESRPADFQARHTRVSRWRPASRRASFARSARRPRSKLSSAPHGDRAARDSRSTPHASRPRRSARRSPRGRPRCAKLRPPLLFRATFRKDTATAFARKRFSARAARASPGSSRTSTSSGAGRWRTWARSMRFTRRCPISSSARVSAATFSPIALSSEASRT